MNGFVKQFTIAFSIFFSLQACTYSQKSSTKSDTIVNYKIIKGEPLPPSQWHCYNVEEEKICIPDKWTYVDQDRFFFIAKPVKGDSNSCFSVLKNNKNQTGFDLLGYVKQICNEIKADKTINFTGYKIVKMTYADKNVYKNEFYTSVNNKQYIIYSTIFETENNIFEIALKVEEATSKQYKELYSDIIFNFYSNGTTVFSAKDKLKNIQEINLSSPVKSL